MDLQNANIVDEAADSDERERLAGIRKVETAIRSQMGEGYLAGARADKTNYYAVLDQGIARPHGYTLGGEPIEIIEIDYFARDMPDECECGMALDDMPPDADECPGCGLDLILLKAELCEVCGAHLLSGDGYYIGDDMRPVCKGHVYEF